MYLVCPALGFLLAAQTRMYYKDAKFAPLFVFKDMMLLKKIQPRDCGLTFLE